MKKDLEQIAQSYGTDKSKESHFFTRYYQDFFDKLIDMDLKLLEIGVLKGSSLKMWQEYFSKAKIYGIDLLDTSFLNTNRIKTFIGNQTDSAFLRRINDTDGPFDIIIDDGCHNSKAMRLSFEALFPMLKAGGYYVIEDLCCCYWPSHIDEHPTFIEYIKGLIDDVNCRGKSPHANRDLDTSYSTLQMTYYESNIEAIHMFRSICFIKKNIA
jgi:hypothetical protein